MKSGWKTSEFWVMLGTVGASLFGMDVNLMTTAVSSAYVVGRSAVKMWDK